MSVQAESNLPNSRLTTALQAVDVNSGNIINIDGESVNDGTKTRKALSVQLAQPSTSGALSTNANINQYQGLTAFNMSNPFVPEKFDQIIPTFDSTNDYYEFKISGTHICSIVITYTTTSKKIMSNVRRVA